MFFCDVKYSNIAIGQLNALKSLPYTSKFTIDDLEQIGTIFKSIVGFGKFLGAVEPVRSPNLRFCPISDILTFGQISNFSQIALKN